MVMYLMMKRLKKLFANGLSTLLISVYDGPEDAEKFEKNVFQTKS